MRQDDLGPKFPDLIGVARGMLLCARCMCHVSAFGLVDPIRLLES